MHEKPRPPATVWILSFLAALGLVAQFLAAEAAFSQTATSWLHSISAAALIEAAIVIDALVVVGSGNRIAALGLAVGVVVSGTYNYTQAASHSTLVGWQLYAQAIGPLAALASIGLALGYELRGYYAAVDAWEAGEAAEAESEMEIARRRQDWIERQRLELELEQERLDREFQRKERRRRRLQEKRLEEKRIATGLTGHRPDMSEPAERLPEPRPVRWADKSAFLEDVSERPDLLDELTGDEVARLSGLSAAGSGRRWLREARDMVSGNGHR